MPLNSLGLTERQRAVVATMRMRMPRDQALAYLRGEGFPMSNATLGRIKSWLRRTTLERLHHVAQFEFRDQHLERIDSVEHIAKLMWQNYFLEPAPYRRVLILREIKELQPYISSYYDTTRMVLESAAAAERLNAAVTKQGNTGLPEPAGAREQA